MIESAGGGRSGTAAGATTLRPGARAGAGGPVGNSWSTPPGTSPGAGAPAKTVTGSSRRSGFRGNRPVAPRRDHRADEIAPFANGSGGTLLRGVTDGDGNVAPVPGAVGAPAGVS